MMHREGKDGNKDWYMYIEKERTKTRDLAILISSLWFISTRLKHSGFGQIGRSSGRGLTLKMWLYEADVLW